MRLQQRGNPFGRPGALLDPVIHAFEVDAQVLLVIPANRVEEADTLDIAAVPTIAAVGNDQVIKRALFRASARKTNTNHYIPVKILRRRTRLIPGRPE